MTAAMSHALLQSSKDSPLDLETKVTQNVCSLMDCQQSFLSLKSFPQFFFLRQSVKCSLEKEEQLSNHPEKGAQRDAQTLPALGLQSMMVGGPSVKWLHSTALFVFLSKHSH